MPLAYKVYQPCVISWLGSTDSTAARGASARGQRAHAGNEGLIAERGALGLEALEREGEAAGKGCMDIGLVWLVMTDPPLMAEEGA